MGARKFQGKGAGLGVWAGCGFGVGWGFGGAPLGVAGLSMGGMCGVVAGLGWGAGFGIGTQYINVSPEFTEGKQHRPNVIKQVQYLWKRLSTLQSTPAGASGLAVLLTAAVKLRQQPRQAPATAAAAPPPADGAKAAAPAGVDWRHPLFRRVAEDLTLFTLSGITHKMVEQAYCQGTRASMRVQVVNGSVYIAGESPSYESRLLNLKRQLFRLWLDGGLPDGIDFVLEQEDGPTVRPRSDDCPIRGPIIAAAKQPANASHAHVLLAPDHSFAGWLEAHTLAWDEMLPLLQRAARQHPWERRSSLLFFRGASTGGRNLTDPQLSEAHPDLLDVKLVNWTFPEEAPQFVSLSDHCAYRQLLHLPGNSYAGRLKYLMACGSAVVMPESSWVEFWYHLLRPGHNIVMVEEVTLENRGHHLAEAAAELKQDDGLARRLGAAGAALVANALAPRMVQAYWQLLLGEYRKLQDYNVTVPHPDAVPLERSILVPEVSNVTRRTCSVCVPTRDMLMAQRMADLGLSGDDPVQLVLPVWPGDGAVVEGGSGSGSHGLVGMEGSGGGGGSLGSRRGGHGRAAGRQDE